jgi:hypothetical protein
MLLRRENKGIAEQLGLPMQETVLTATGQGIC